MFDTCAQLLSFFCKKYSCFIFWPYFPSSTYSHILPDLSTSMLFLSDKKQTNSNWKVQQTKPTNKLPPKKPHRKYKHTHMPHKTIKTIIYNQSTNQKINCLNKQYETKTSQKLLLSFSVYWPSTAGPGPTLKYETPLEFLCECVSIQIALG